MYIAESLPLLASAYSAKASPNCFRFDNADGGACLVAGTVERGKKNRDQQGDTRRAMGEGRWVCLHSRFVDVLG